MSARSVAALGDERLRRQDELLDERIEIDARICGVAIIAIAAMTLIGILPDRARHDLLRQQGIFALLWRQ